MKDDKIVVTKTPLRVSFLGGGTDMPYFYDKYGGATISCTINRYIYVTAKFHNNYQEKYRLNYSKTENTNDLSKIKNLRIKKVIEKMGITKPLYINTFADIPANSGLGSSSSFTVGLIKALCKLQNKKMTKNQLAEMAYEIESKITKNSLGKQDHYIAAHGGLKYIRYNKNKISVSSLDLDRKNIKNFFNNMFLIWTGKNRFASSVLKDQKKNLKENYINLIALNFLTKKFKNEILSKKIKIKNIGKLIKESWELKKSFSKLITNNDIEKIFKKIDQKGAYGGKLLGAGNGGFILVVISPSKKKKLVEYIKKHQYIVVKLEKEGSILI